LKRTPALQQLARLVLQPARQDHDALLRGVLLEPFLVLLGRWEEVQNGVWGDHECWSSPPDTTTKARKSAESRRDIADRLEQTTCLKFRLRRRAAAGWPAAELRLPAVCYCHIVRPAAGERIIVVAAFLTRSAVSKQR
jgi:hypothetical protein